MVFFIFTVLFYNVRAEIKNKALDQRYAALDLALESSLVSSAPGNLKVSYAKDPDFSYSIKNQELIVFYGTAEEAYRFLLSNAIFVEENELGLVLKKHE